MINTKQIIIVFLFSCIAVSCNNSETLSEKQSAIVQDSVRKMIESIPKDLSAKGPVVWLKYFEHVPGFFMASEGKLAFSNYDSAIKFINDPHFKDSTNVKLQWSNIKIDPLSVRFANVGAIYHEVIRELNRVDEDGMVTGSIIEVNGYFTGIAEKTEKGWQLRNAHWSTIKK